VRLSTKCQRTNSAASNTTTHGIPSARLLKNAWTNAWEEPGAPEALPMPLQNLLVADAHQRLMQSGRPEVIPMPVGQIVGRMNEVRPVAAVMADLVSEYEQAVARLTELGRINRG